MSFWVILWLCLKSGHLEKCHGEKNACQGRGSDFTLTCERRPDGNQKIEESLGVTIQSRGLSWVEI